MLLPLAQSSASASRFGCFSICYFPLFRTGRAPNRCDRQRARRRRRLLTVAIGGRWCQESYLAPCRAPTRRRREPGQHPAGEGAGAGAGSHAQWSTWAQIVAGHSKRPARAPRTFGWGGQLRKQWPSCLSKAAPAAALAPAWFCVRTSVRSCGITNISTRQRGRAASSRASTGRVGAPVISGLVSVPHWNGSAALRRCVTQTLACTLARGHT